MDQKDINRKGPMKKQRLFRDYSDGLQLHAGALRGKPLWHSDDGGETWWSGRIFSHDANITRAELIEMAEGIIRDTSNAGHEARRQQKQEGGSQ